MNVSQKNQMLNKVAEHIRKSYHSMDCKKKEKHNTKILHFTVLPENKTDSLLCMHSLSQDAL